MTLLFLVSACSSYKQHVMFKTEGGSYPQDLEYSRLLAERNYRIQVNDQLYIRIYTNEGERIIDPDYVFRITSYNVCYTKLLRQEEQEENYHDQRHAAHEFDELARNEGQWADPRTLGDHQGKAQKQRQGEG